LGDRAAPTQDEYPAESSLELIPHADVVVLTGSSPINHTRGNLLSLCRLSSLVLVLSPSTTLSPVLFDHGASMISGTLVMVEASVLRTVAQGATIQQVEGVRLLTIAR
jgi:uncharacterized protein